VPAVGDFGGLAKKVMASNSGKAPDVVLAVGSYSNIGPGSLRRGSTIAHAASTTS